MTTHEKSYNYVLDIQVGNNVNVMFFSIYINNIEKNIPPRECTLTLTKGKIIQNIHPPHKIYKR